jgi:hypothetical protein
MTSTRPATTSHRCHICGRVGSRGFRQIPETVVTTFGVPFTVGGWWQCLARKACLRRFDLLRPRTRGYDE